MNLLRIAAWSVVFVAIISVSPEAKADAISPYTYTNLGPDSSYSTDANGNRIIVASDGQKYAFPGSSPTRYTADQFAQMGAPIPTVVRDPHREDYSAAEYGGAISNGKGYFVSTISIYSLYSSAHDTANELLVTRQLPDGTFTPMDIGYTQHYSYAGGGRNAIQLLDMNKNNLVLARVDNPYYPAAMGTLLYDINTGKSSILTPGFNGQFSDFYPAFPGMSLDYAIAIDDQGRILFAADRRGEMDRVLLTPEGVSSIAIPTPEPSTLTMTTIALVGVAFRRLIQRRSPKSEVPVG